MSDVRPYWPIEPRPYVQYRTPPTLQATRSETIRGAWADVRRFLGHVQPYEDGPDVIVLTINRWSEESMRSQGESWLGEWPAECSREEYDAALRLAIDCFAEAMYTAPKERAEKSGLEDEQMWRLPVERAEEVFDYLERVPACTGGLLAPVHASYSRLFLFRDLKSGELLPGQESRHLPAKSHLYVYLQRRPVGHFGLLLLPFAEPDTSAADYVVALQEHLPLWLDPRYFDHAMPTADGSSYLHRRLPSEWIGLDAEGNPRLDASRSGITPAEIDLPTDAEMASEDPERDDALIRANFDTILAALRDHAMAAMVIQGASAADHLVEQAATRLGMPMHSIRTMRMPPNGLTFAEELRVLVSELTGEPAVMLVEATDWMHPDAAVAIVAQAATRTIDDVMLPAEVRLVVLTEGTASAEMEALESRLSAIRAEGFGTPEQHAFLSRLEWRAENRNMTIELVLPPQ